MLDLWGYDAIASAIASHPVAYFVFVFVSGLVWEVLKFVFKLLWTGI